MQCRPVSPPVHDARFGGEILVPLPPGEILQPAGGARLPI